MVRMLAMFPFSREPLSYNVQGFWAADENGKNGKTVEQFYQPIDHRGVQQSSTEVDIILCRAMHEQV